MVIGQSRRSSSLYCTCAPVIVWNDYSGSYYQATSYISRPLPSSFQVLDMPLRVSSIQRMRPWTGPVPSDLCLRDSKGKPSVRKGLPIYLHELSPRAINCPPRSRIQSNQSFRFELSGRVKKHLLCLHLVEIVIASTCQRMSLPRFMSLTYACTASESGLMSPTIKL